MKEKVLGKYLVISAKGHNVLWHIDDLREFEAYFSLLSGTKMDDLIERLRGTAIEAWELFQKEVWIAYIKHKAGTMRTLHEIDMEMTRLRKESINKE
jgi:hypothetical protein